MSFDRLARHYRWLEAVLAGHVLQRARAAHLPALTHACDILLLGEGPGRFLEAIVQADAGDHITVVDSSPAMLQAAARRCGGARQRIDWVEVDLRHWSPPRSRFDVVVTSCVLDCFSARTLGQLIPRWAEAARAEASWLYIDFALPSRGWRRRRAQAIHALMYAVFRGVTGIEARRVTPPDEWLARAGFSRRSSAEFSAGLIRSEWWHRSAGSGTAHSGIAAPVSSLGNRGAFSPARCEPSATRS